MSESERDSTPIDDSAAGERLDRWLAAPERLGSRKRAADALARGKISIDGTELGVRDGGRILVAGERVRIWIDRPGSGKGNKGLAERARTRGGASARGRGRGRGAPLSILHEDADCLAVDKPAGLLTVPRPGGEDSDDTVLARLEALIDPARRRRLFVVHRIDRGTSGVVLFARHRKASKILSEQFRARSPLRRYRALAAGAPGEESGTWEDRLSVPTGDRVVRPAHAGEEGSRAACRFRVVERFPGGASLLEIELETGKRNQIRVQCAMRGFPLIGDALYADLAGGRAVIDPLDPDHGRARGRVALHAALLGFVQPTSRETIECAAPWPRDLEALATRLRSASASSGKESSA